MESTPEFFRNAVKKFKAADALLSSQLKLHQDMAAARQSEAAKKSSNAERAATGYMHAIDKRDSPSENYPDPNTTSQIDSDIITLKNLSVIIKSHKDELDRVDSQIGTLQQELHAALSKERSDRSKRILTRAAIAVAAVCVLIFLHFWLLDRTTLSFAISLDGKDFPAGINPSIAVDGKPFATESKINLGRHQIVITFPGGETFSKNVWVFYEKNDLGILPLESSKGSLSVTVKPSPATVVVEQESKKINQGDAPLKIQKLPVGDYIVRVLRGVYEEKRLVSIERQQQTETNIVLNLGGLQLFSDASDTDCELSGSGRHWSGKLPIAIDDVPGGNYSLTVTRKGWEQTKTVSISRGSITTNKTEFPYGSIELTSDPSGLVISTNGVEIGKTPIVLSELKPGQYSFTASDGENDLSEDVDVAPKAAAKHAFVFQYGTVQLSSTPIGATVIRKGKEIGKTPLTLNHIPAGDTMVELRFQGYVSTNLPIHAVEGDTTKLSAKLTSERYVQAMKQAHEALDAAKYAASSRYVANVSEDELTKSRKFLAVALEAEPNDPGAIALQDEVSKAVQNVARARKETERLAAIERKAAEQKEIVAIIEKSITAHGGRDVVVRFLASKQVSTVLRNFKDGTPFTARATTYSQSPDKIRMEQEIRYKPKTLLGGLSSIGLNVTVNGQTPNQEKIIHVTECIAGSEAWEMTEGARHAMPPRLEQNLRDGLYFGEITRLVPLLSKDFELEMIPSSQNPIHSSTAIKVRKEGKPDFTIYFDNDKGLMIALEFEEQDLSGNGTIVATINYSSFRSFSGLILPTRLQLDHGWNHSSTVNIESTELYQSLPDSVFRPSNY